MAVITYLSWAEYLEAVQENCDKITKIDQIIDALLVQGIEAAGTSDTEGYTLDNGQSIIKVNYRNVDAIAESIKAFEKLRTLYKNRIGGRQMQLKDKRATRGYRYYGFS